MCPLCDRTCDYWELSNTCFYARLTYLFDNDLTVLFAFLMSIWGKVSCSKKIYIVYSFFFFLDIFMFFFLMFQNRKNSVF